MCRHRWAAAALLCAAAQAGTLESGFRQPPDSARPWTYWFWSNGNLTKEGITADLESLARVGIRGVVIMEVDAGTPAGTVPFLSPAWREMFQHTLREAGRLGIEVDMNNDGGWMGSGGPWITPDLSMQMLVWSETRVPGGRRYRAGLARPKANSGYYRDIAVLAFPTPPAEAASTADARVTLGKTTDIELQKPFAAQSLSVALDRYHSTAAGTLSVSEDGKHYRTVRQFEAMWPQSGVNFEPVAARWFRINLAEAPSRVELHAAPRMEDIPGKAAFINHPYRAGAAAIPGDACVDRAKVLDLSTRMDASGRLDWNAPAGEWTVLRIGHTTTGKMNHPAPAPSLGLECDKLSRKAVEVHFAALLGKLVADQRASGARALRYAHIDSWESGPQNWTPGFRQEFRTRRGYDLLQYLPVLTGRAVESSEISERFLWDFRRTIADLLLTEYAGTFRELCHKHGLKLSIEAYGNGPLDDLHYAGYADLPVTEFWVEMEPWWAVREMTSAAHVYGKPVIASEAFTCRTAAGRWQSHPFRLKPLGDRIFTLGVNRLVMHRTAMQPWPNLRPGVMMGPYGIHFERTNTWWEQGKAWVDYLTRCQHLLQQGRFVADIGYVNGEGLPNDYHEPLTSVLESPAGYDYDVIPAGSLEQVAVRDGHAVLPSGMNYRVLALRTGGSMRVAQLRRLKALVEAGATLVGAPPSKSPSLAESDAEIRRLAGELWGDCDGAEITEHRFGKGRVIWGQPFAQVLGTPDFASLGGLIRYTHRSVDGREVYFLASGESQAATFLCSFRVAGKTPELWWPDSGRIQRVALYDQAGAQTRIPIRLDPYGSVFVVFGEGGEDAVKSLTRDGVDISGLSATNLADLRGKLEGVTLEGGYRLETTHSGVYEVMTASGRRLSARAEVAEPLAVTGPWEVSFPSERITLDRLVSWTARPEDSVRHFSGTASYRRSLTIPTELLGGRLYLDLGRVEVIAEVRLNGRDLGTLWKPPFRVDITDAARAGVNDLEIRVVNLWPNRLIGDARLPEDTERDGNRTKTWPQWLLDGKPSPTGKQTFMSWRIRFADDPLMESGLLGPVMLVPARVLQLR